MGVGEPVAPPSGAEGVAGPSLEESGTTCPASLARTRNCTRIRRAGLERCLTGARVRQRRQ
eukprot:9282959-Lingulodinium_polyedra.AAC.1